MFPKDYVNSDGKLLWSGYNRFPNPLIFNINDETHFNFISSATKIYAKIFKVPVTEDLYRLALELESPKDLFSMGT